MLKIDKISTIFNTHVILTLLMQLSLIIQVLLSGCCQVL